LILHLQLIETSPLLWVGKYGIQVTVKRFLEVALCIESSIVRWRACSSAGAHAGSASGTCTPDTSRSASRRACPRRASCRRRRAAGAGRRASAYARTGTNPRASTSRRACACRSRAGSAAGRRAGSTDSGGIPVGGPGGGSSGGSSRVCVIHVPARGVPARSGSGSVAIQLDHLSFAAGKRIAVRLV
jgi:hypothetical protein